MHDSSEAGTVVTQDPGQRRFRPTEFRGVKFSVADGKVLVPDRQGKTLDAARRLNTGELFNTATKTVTTTTQKLDGTVKESTRRPALDAPDDQDHAHRLQVRRAAADLPRRTELAADPAEHHAVRCVDQHVVRSRRRRPHRIAGDDARPDGRTRLHVADPRLPSVLEAGGLAAGPYCR